MGEVREWKNPNAPGGFEFRRGKGRKNRRVRRRRILETVTFPSL
jgi:hypothetical protein